METLKKFIEYAVITEVLEKVLKLCLVQGVGNTERSQR